MKKQKNNSEIVADFLNLISEDQTLYGIAYEYVGKLEKATSDTLHKLEIESATEKNKTATQLRNLQLDRRYYKDMRQLTEILKNWSETHKTAVEQLKQALGKIRKEEDYQSDRTYYPRVLKWDETLIKPKGGK